MIQLRGYQDNATNAIRQAYLSGNRAPLLVLPTGGGKTVIFTYIAATSSGRGKRVLILVHRIELLRQTSQALHKFSIPHGLVNPSFTPNLSHSVQVASVQTLIRRLDRFWEPNLVIIDEAHHAVASTYRKVMEKWPKALVLGVTATPVRGDGVGLGYESGGIFDRMILGPSVSELISLGYLVKPVVYGPTDRIDLSGVKIVRGDYDQKELERRIDKPMITGNAIDHYRRICPGVPCVVFCTSVSHAEHVASQFKAAGFRAASVDGSMDDNTRKSLLAGLGNGNIQVITSCDLIGEGVDIPAVGCAILLRPTQSVGLYIQQVGRALRPCEGKDRAVILDHAGNVLLHGMPDEDREWSLDGEPKRKSNARSSSASPYKSASVMQCDSCGAIHQKARSCPICGHVHPVPEQDIQYVDGELEQLTPEMMNEIRRQKRMEVSEAQTIDDLRKIAKERGYKAGWIRHQWSLKKARESVPNGVVK